MPAVLGLALAAWVSLHPMRSQSSWDAQALYALMTLTLASLVIRPPTRALDGRFLAHVGKVSYGIYLLHMFVISSVKKLPGAASPEMCFLVSSTLVILIASLVYKWFEFPLIRFYKQRLSPLGPQTVTVKSTPMADAPCPPSEPSVPLAKASSNAT
ncbi:MAG: acyltransferase [Verrucomicrobia bacterium]|nr:acyltransferase [Verrucomicrobiota bacterium]